MGENRQEALGDGDRRRALKAIAKFTSAQLEPDTKLREELLEASVAPDARLEFGDDTFDSIGSLSSEIARRLQDPRYAVRRRERPVAAGDGWSFSLSIGVPESFEDQRFFATIRDGRITELKLRSRSLSRPSLTRRAVGWGISNPLAAVAVVTGAIYIVVRVPLSIFYGRLGTTPDEVGLGTQDVVRQSILLVGAIAGVTLVVTALLWTIGIAFGSEVAVATRLNRLNRRRLAIASGLILLWTYLWGISGVFFLGLLGETGWLLVLLYILVLVVGLTLPRLMPGTRAARRDTFDAVRRRTGGVWRMAVPLFGMYLLMFAALGLTLAAVQTADDVRSGGTVSLPLVVWSARPVTLHWTKAPALPLKDDSCRVLRYLGSTNQRVVVFDTRVGETVSMPASDVSASFPSSCPGS